MFKSFVASAPGKVILSGEHAVVHGTHAIATVVDRRSRAAFSPNTPLERHAELTTAQIPDSDISLTIQYDNGTVLIHQWSLPEVVSHQKVLYQQCMDAIDDYDNVGQKYFTTQDKLLQYIQEHTHPSKHLHCKHHYTLDALVDIFDKIYATLPATILRYTVTTDKDSPISIVDRDTLDPSVEVCPAKVFLMYYFFILASSTKYNDDTAPLTPPPCHVFLDSSVPMGSGLGSSASVCGSLATGYYNILRQIEQHDHDLGHKKLNLSLTLSQRKVINHWAFEGERIIHGTPSGVDNSCVVYGGVVSFRRVNGEVELDFLPSGCLPQTMQILITNTKQPKNTKALVAGVRELKQQYPMIIEPLFHSIEQITQVIIKTIQQYIATKTRQELHKLKKASGEEVEDDEEEQFHTNENVCDEDVYAMFRTVLAINQNLLNAIGVGHAKIDEVVNIARAFGDNFITKLTGAGGGGCVISLAKPCVEQQTIEEFTAQCEKSGFDVLVTHMGQNGVMLHEKL